MKSRLKNATRELGSNRGSGVVLVLVAISCITLMTTSLLHLSYTAFKMKAAERQNKIEFYKADAQMDELLAGVQGLVSQAIGEAQKNVFIKYNNSVNEQHFRSSLLEELKEVLVEEGTSYKYKASILNKLLNDGLEGEKDIVTSSNPICEIDEETNRFVLRNVCITYVDEKSGNYTTIKTDILIDASKLKFKYVDIGKSQIQHDSGEWNLVEIVKYENWSTY